MHWEGVHWGGRVHWGGGVHCEGCIGKGCIVKGALGGVHWGGGCIGKGAL